MKGTWNYSIDLCKMTKKTKLNKTVRRKHVSRLQKSLLGKTKRYKDCPEAFKSFEGKEFEKEYSLGSVKANNSYEKNLVHVFKTALAPSKVTPQDDYYDYINYEWINKQRKVAGKEAKKFYVQIDSFRVTQEKVYFELNDIIKDYIKTHDTRKAKEVSNMYHSLITLSDKSAAMHMKECLSDLNGLFANKDLYKLLAYINKNEIVNWGAPIVWTLLPDEKNANKYISTLSAPQLSAYDYMLYLEDNKEDERGEKYKKLFKHKFLEYVRNIFKVASKHNNEKHPYKAEHVWEVEYEILLALGCDKIKKDSPEYYNVVHGKDALKKYNFDWNKFAKELGYERAPETFICTSLNYLNCIMELLHKDWLEPKWKSYFHYLFLRQIILFGKTYRNISYEFKGKFIEARGQYPIEVEAIFGMSICFNTLLTNEYVRRNNREREMNYVRNLAHDLKEVFLRIIRRNTWLSPSTKKSALQKLEHLKFIIGSPELLREDPLLNYTDDDPWGNLVKLTRWKTAKQIGLEGKDTLDIPVVDWNKLKLIGTQAYVVNAYYTPVQNSIYFPLAYLQKPFIDLDERGLEYNLAFVGYTIGHEMSHMNS